MISILIPHSFNILALQSFSDRLHVETNPEWMFAQKNLKIWNLTWSVHHDPVSSCHQRERQVLPCCCRFSDSQDQWIHPTQCTPQQHELRTRIIQVCQILSLFTIFSSSVGVRITRYKTVDPLLTVGTEMLQLHDHLVPGHLGIMDGEMSSFIKKMFGDINGRRFSSIT